MRQKTSLKDIAKEVGVSTTLVSYVLNNKGKANRVSEKTARKIRKVAKALNYQPNLHARSLKTNRSRTIALVVADISNPFFSNLARTIEDEAYSQNYTVIFGSSDETVEKFKKVLEFLHTRQVDGFIIASPEGSQELVIDLIQSGIPVVLIDRYFSEIQCHSVIVDNYKASYEATNYLLNKGHKRIGAVMYSSSMDHYQDRSNGYKEALSAAGIFPGDKYLKTVNHTTLQQDMNKAIRDLILENEVDAIYFLTNTIATEGLKQILELGKKIPEEVDVVAFDQNQAYQFFENFIPYVSQPIKEMGQTAVRILIEQIEGMQKEPKKIGLNATLEIATRNLNAVLPG